MRTVTHGRSPLVAILFASVLATAPVISQLIDPLLESQWHLKSRLFEVAGANVRDSWGTARGAGVRVGIVDDGLQHAHPDLAPNYDAAYSYDFNGGDPDPAPTSSDPHGTSVAGVAAGAGDNGIGGSGAAPGARLAGLRLIAGPISDLDIANAIAYQAGQIQVLSNSWGPSDNGATVSGPGPLSAAAMEDAAVNGRGGLGRALVWAAGNGRNSADNCNFDGYANSRFTIAVLALADTGDYSWYSEPCAAAFVTAPSNGGSRGITTTDLLGAAGYASGDYTSTFGGTSSAAPLVSGIIALVLSANPALTWRDVQYILAQTAVKVHPDSPGWTGGAYPHHEDYGFGLIDAAAAVSAATGWSHVGPPVSTSRIARTVNLPVPDNNPVGVTDSITFDSTFNTFEVERVEVDFSALHTWRGDLTVTLVSPSGVESHLATLRPNDSNDNFSNWRFGSVRHWGETASGTWTLRVADGYSGDAGTWLSWSLRLYGQQGCAYSVAPASASFGAAGGGGNFTVTADGDCAWSATTTASWIALTPPAAGAGNGTVSYTVAPYSGSTARQGTIDVAGQTHVVTQTGVPSNSVTISSPEPGSKAFTGSPLFVDWSIVENTAVSAFNVFSSADGGLTFTTIPACSALPPSARRCTWPAPSPTTPAARLKVVATDIYGNEASDETDGNFTIVAGAATLTIAAPNTATNWGIGTVQTIKWSHNLGAQSRVDLESTRDGSTWTPIVTNLANTTATTGTFAWVVTGPASATSNVRVVWRGGPASDAGNVPFKIAPAFVDLTMPKSGANLGIGTLQWVQWKHNLGTAAFVVLELSRDGGGSWTPIATIKNPAALSGNYKWLVTGPASAAAALRARWSADATVQDFSSLVIATPFVTVKKPNSAVDAWTIGTSRTITWTSNLGRLEAIAIALSLDGGATYPITLKATTPSDGSEAVVVQAGWATTTALVRISWIKNPAVADSSNATFPIRVP